MVKQQKLTEKSIKFNEQERSIWRISQPIWAYFTSVSITRLSIKAIASLTREQVKECSFARREVKECAINEPSADFGPVIYYYLHVAGF